MTARERAEKFLKALKISTNVPLPISSATCDVEVLDDLESEIMEAEGFGFKRGMEEAAKIADSHDFTLDKNRRVADFIRSAIEKKEKA